MSHSHLPLRREALSKPRGEAHVGAGDVVRRAAGVLEVVLLERRELYLYKVEAVGKGTLHRPLQWRWKAMVGGDEHDDQCYIRMGTKEEG